MRKKFVHSFYDRVINLFVLLLEWLDKLDKKSSSPSGALSVTPSF